MIAPETAEVLDAYIDGLAATEPEDNLEVADRLRRNPGEQDIFPRFGIWDVPAELGRLTLIDYGTGARDEISVDRLYAAMWDEKIGGYGLAAGSRVLAMTTSSDNLAVSPRVSIVRWEIVGERKGGYAFGRNQAPYKGAETRADQLITNMVSTLPSYNELTPVHQDFFPSQIPLPRIRSMPSTRS